MNFYLLWNKIYMHSSSIKNHKSLHKLRYISILGTDRLHT